MARPKSPATITISVTFPRRKGAAYACRYWVPTDSDGFGRHEYHRLKEGDHLTRCAERYCSARTCQEHTEEHQAQHTLEKLGGR